MKEARCTLCRSEFTADEMAGHSACPTCGRSDVPMAIRDDVMVSINVHELRILGIWAENYASSVDHRELDNASHQSLRSVVEAIVKPLEVQLAALGHTARLTLMGEVKTLTDQGINVTLIRNGAEEVESPEN